jgi:uncharacterized OB-fold protein
MKHPAPNAAGTAAEHWKAAAGRRLALPYCASCAEFQWPPRAGCLHCRGEMSWRDASGRGRIVSFSVARRAVHPELADEAPYVIAFVELDEGPRIFTNVVDVDAGAITTGMRVRCRFEAALDETVSVPVFAPET